jgi:hypothetical protein
LTLCVVRRLAFVWPPEPCGAAGQERILAQMQEGDARKTRR